jgi:hypothetical protein
VIRRATIELLLATAAAAGCVLSWLSARSTVVVAPVLPGEPMTTSVVYSPPLLVLALLLATVAGVLTISGVTHLRDLGPRASWGTQKHPKSP